MWILVAFCWFGTLCSRYPSAGVGLGIDFVCISTYLIMSVSPVLSSFSAIIRFRCSIILSSIIMSVKIPREDFLRVMPLAGQKQRFTFSSFSTTASNVTITTLLRRQRPAVPHLSASSGLPRYTEKHPIPDRSTLSPVKDAH